MREWMEVRAELLTPEQIDESNFRVSIIGQNDKRLQRKKNTSTRIRKAKRRKSAY